MSEQKSFDAWFQLNTRYHVDGAPIYPDIRQAWNARQPEIDALKQRVDALRGALSKVQYVACDDCVEELGEGCACDYIQRKLAREAVAKDNEMEKGKV